MIGITTGHELNITTYKLIEPKCIGMNGAFATRSPSSENNAQEKSNRSLIFVLIAVCCKDLPIYVYRQYIILTA